MRPAGVTISAVTPTGTLHVGDPITIRGASFNTLSADARLAFRARGNNAFSSPLAEMKVISNSELTAVVPPDAITGDIRIIEAVQCSGPTANSGSVIVYTLAAGPALDIDNQMPLAPFDREGVAISETEVELSWTAGDPTFRDGFEIYVSDDFGRSYRHERTIHNAEAEMALVVGLMSGTTYYFDIVAFGKGGRTVTDSKDIVVVTTFGPTPGSGALTISGSTGGLCDGSPTLTRVEAFFDTDTDKVVDGATGDPTRGAYPHSIEWRISDDPAQLPQRAVFSSSSFGRTAAGSVGANLVIVGYFSGCVSTQFVAAHLAVWEEDNTVTTEGISLLVGDRATRVIGGDYGDGIILETLAFDPMLLLGPLRMGRAAGSIRESVQLVDLGTGQTFRATVQFSFDAPIEMR